MGGCTQIWDKFMWLTPGYGSLSTRAPLHWEQKSHFKQNQPSCTRNMGWRSLEPRSPSVTLKDSKWFGNDPLLLLRFSLVALPWLHLGGWSAAP